MSDPTMIDDDGRQTAERRDERAKWTRDIAEILRGMTASPDYAAYCIAADFLDPPLAAPASPSEPAAKITTTLRLERTKLGERPGGIEFVDGWLNDAQGRTLAALSLPTRYWEALESALSGSVEPVLSTPRVWAGPGCCRAAYESEGHAHDHSSGPRVWAMPEIPEDVKRLRDRHGWRWGNLDGLWYRTWPDCDAAQTKARGATGQSMGWMLASRGPLTEVEETNDAD